MEPCTDLFASKPVRAREGPGRPGLGSFGAAALIGESSAIVVRVEGEKGGGGTGYKEDGGIIFKG